MLKEERHDFIIKQINIHNKVVSSELSDQLKVSEDTIRRDLNDLAKDGRVLKVFGGALSKGFHYPFQQPEVYAKERKKEIAKKALSLIKDGMIVLAGGGTVMIELAKLIPENLKGTFFTVSPLVALEVSQRSTVDVILLGGHVSRNSYICTGASVVNQLCEMHADLCFIGTNGLSTTLGVTDYDWDVVQVKKAMIKSSRKTALLTISEKLDVDQKLQVSRLQAIDYLITELKPSDDKLKHYSKSVILK